MTTITMDYDEFEKLKTKASRNEAKIKEEVNREFNNWRKQYEEQRKLNLELSKEGILQAIRIKKTLFSTDMFGKIKYEEVVKCFDELEDMIREM